MPEHQNDGQRQWWRNPATLGAIASLITAIATLIAVLTGQGDGLF